MLVTYQPLYERSNHLRAICVARTLYKVTSVVTGRDLSALTAHRWRKNEKEISRYRKRIFPSGDPPTAHDNVAIVEDGGLTRSDGALGFVKCNENLIVICGFDRGHGTGMAVADLYQNA